MQHPHERDQVHSSRATRLASAKNWLELRSRAILSILHMFNFNRIVCCAAHSSGGHSPVMLAAVPPIVA
jgi:hypothetical protein